MNNLATVLWSSVGRKLLAGLTGLGLFLFVCIHLLGNLTLLIPDGGRSFNAYAHFLTHELLHGWLVYAAEAGLLAFFLAHAVVGVRIYLDRSRVRPRGYHKVADAGGSSQKSFSSMTMAFTGAVLFVYVILHLLHFKFGPGEARGYVTTLESGVQVRDLYRLVVQEFKDPVNVGFYVFVMLLLGIHLNHGFWSAFQSLGASNARYLPLLRTGAVLFAVLLAVGFLLLPLYIYAAVPVPAPGAALPEILGGVA